MHENVYNERMRGFHQPTNAANPPDYNILVISCYAALSFLILLLILLDLREGTSEGDVTMKAAYRLAFAAFLRAGEFTYTQKDTKEHDFALYHLTRNSVTFPEDKIYLHIPSSKTDPFRRGITITVAATGERTFPRFALLDLFKMFPLPP